MSESCVNNMTIFSISFFLFFSFCSVVVLKRVFVWEVGFKKKKKIPLVCVPCTFAITHHEKSRTSVVEGERIIEKEDKSNENEPG